VQLLVMALLQVALCWLALELATTWVVMLPLSQDLRQVVKVA
jgi:hypothetical protein